MHKNRSLESLRILIATTSLVFVISFVVCDVFSLMVGLPYPRIHDEYSYCLAGETFAMGRLTNPVHPMAEHFETMHVLQHPSYMSKYPPGQGLVLMMGRWLGHPIFGVWLSLALASTAITWAIGAVEDTVWAAVCGVLFTFSMNCLSYFDQIGYWAHSYWGGSVASLGSALAFGAVLWLGKESEDRGAANSPAALLSRSDERADRHVSWLLIVFVVGLWLMAVSRPLEGLLVSIPTFIAMMMQLSVYAKSIDLASMLKILVLPTIVGTVGAIWLGYYNASVSGNPLKLPYVCYEQRYALTPMFLEQPLRASPDFHNEPMRLFHEGWEVGIFQDQQSWRGYIEKKQRDSFVLWEFFLGRSLSIPVVIGCLATVVGLFRRSSAARSRLAIVGLASFGLVVVVHSHTPWMNPHYLAPLVPILWCWIAVGLAAIAPWRLFKFEWGLFLAIALVGLSALERIDQFDLNRSMRVNYKPWHHHRREIEEQFQSTSGLHLVLVEYGPLHSVHEEWCYNAADIDRSKIVWARDLGPTKNEALFQYFSNRVLHRLAIDFGPLKLETVGRIDARGTNSVDRN